MHLHLLFIILLLFVATFVVVRKQKRIMFQHEAEVTFLIAIDNAELQTTIVRDIEAYCGIHGYDFAKRYTPEKSDKLSFIKDSLMDSSYSSDILVCVSPKYFIEDYEVPIENIVDLSSDDTLWMPIKEVVFQIGTQYEIAFRTWNQNWDSDFIIIRNHKAIARYWDTITTPEEIQHIIKPATIRSNHVGYGLWRKVMP